MKPPHPLRRGLIDTHCHLHEYANPLAVAESARQEGMRLHVMTVNPDEYEQVRTQFAGLEHVVVAPGFFPVGIEKIADQLDRFLKQMQEVQLVGEIGLDFVSKDAAIRELQRMCLEKIVRAANETGGKILSLHSRRAGNEVINIFEAGFSGAAILHWFSGSWEAIARARQIGMWFSLNPAMVASSRSRRLIQHMPRERVLCETDGPHVKVGDRPANPIDLISVVQCLARLWDVSPEAAVDQLRENQYRLMRNEANR